MSTQNEFIYPSGGEFTDDELYRYLRKQGTRPSALLKKTHETFEVREVNLDGVMYTADSVSNLTADQIANPPAKTKHIRVTCCKRGLTTGHTEGLLKAQLRDLGFEVRITYAGNKDRTAVTAQGFVIEILNSPEGKDAMAPSIQNRCHSGKPFTSSS